jgi:hypothetical protein
VAEVVGMSANDLSALFNVILVVATIMVVFFAYQTVMEAKRTTDEQRPMVAQLQKLVQTAQYTASTSASTMEAAKATASSSGQHTRGGEGDGPDRERDAERR